MSTQPTETNQQVTTNQPTETTPQRVRLIISRNATGPLIGQQGSVIKSIQQDTDTLIRINGEPEDRVLGNILSTIINDRIVTITSPDASNIAQAVGRIAPILQAARLEQRPDAKIDPNVFNIRFLIHYPAISEFIGAGGNNITNIRDRTKARITVRSSETLPFSTERVVHVSGSIEEIVSATEAIVPYLTMTEGVEQKEYRPYVPSVRVDPEEQRVKTTLGIKESQVGVVIGANGRTIQNIRRFTSCVIQVDSNAPQTHMADSIVSVIVSGPESNVNAATKLIRAALKNSQTRASGSAPSTNSPREQPQQQQKA